MMRSAQTAGAPFGGNPNFAGGARYFGTGLEEALDAQIGDTPLSNALTRVLITSYDIAYGEPILFSSFNWPPGAIINTSMRVAARATSAGPTFFEPQVVTVGDRQRVLVDGGVFANNPSMIAYALGTVLAAQAGRQLYLVSLGTGTRNPVRPLTATQVKAQNWLAAAKNVFEAAMTGSGELADMLLPNLMNAQGFVPRYVRIQTTVENCSFGMDDSSAANTACLAQLAIRLIERDKSHLENVAAALLAA
jgi:predicted acylesterase/phospholipase RssA